MRDRLILLIDTVAAPSKRWSDMQRMTMVSSQTWRKVYSGQQRVTQEIICAVAQAWPQYLSWLITGERTCSIAQEAPVRPGWDVAYFPKGPAASNVVGIRPGSVPPPTGGRCAGGDVVEAKAITDDAPAYEGIPHGRPKSGDAFHCRLIIFIDSVANPRQPWQHLEQITGIRAHSWRGAYGGRQRLTEAMFKSIATHWTTLICWLITGQTAWPAEQTCPPDYLSKQ